MRSFAFAIFLAVAASAQSNPNFTGTWKQDNSKSSVQPGSTMQYSNKIDHADPKLAVTTILDYGDRPPTPYTRNYTTDGKPSVSTDREGDKSTTIVRWESNTLVFETGEKDEAGSITTREVWTLSEDGKTLTKKIHTSGPRGESDRTYVLMKQ